MFILTPFTDKNLIIDENFTRNEKRFWSGGYLWWPIDKRFMDRYVAEKGIIPFNVEYKGEIIGHCCIWDDHKCPDERIKVSRAIIYKKYRGKRLKNKPYLYWLIKAVVKRATELFPDKIPYAVVYDFQKNVHNGAKSLALSTILLAGFTEYEREDRIAQTKNILATKIWLEYKN